MELYKKISCYCPFKVENLDVSFPTDKKNSSPELKDCGLTVLPGLTPNPSLPWREPTTDPHGNSWLLGVPPGPLRPSLEAT